MEVTILAISLRLEGCTMEPMALYYSYLLPWTKKALHFVMQLHLYLLWRNRGKMGITWVVWDHLGTLKHLGELQYWTYLCTYNGSWIFFIARPVFTMKTMDMYCLIGNNIWEDNNEGTMVAITCRRYSNYNSFFFMCSQWQPCICIVK